jgi:serine/threonine-protein kinase
VAAALDAAHAAGLVHRDVKPANVLLASDVDHAYLSDFGLMRALDPQVPLTDSGRWMGTVDFAAPEQLSGERVDARSDVYSLGCVLFAALTGKPPFARGTITATMLAHLHDPRPKPSAGGAPRSFDRVIARALAKAPEDRYPSAGDLGRAALAAARGEPVTESERTVAIGPAAPEGSPAETAPTAVVGRRPRLRGRRIAPAPAPRPAPALAAPVPAAPQGRRPTPPPAPLAPADRPPATPSLGRRRRTLGRRGLLAALALPLAGIATVAVLMLGDDGERNAAAAQARPLTENEVRDAADAFAQAYETENARALRRLLTTDVQRVLPTGSARGRNAVATEYESQFRANATESYELEDLDVTGGRAGRASGAYRVRRAQRPSITGRIVLGVVRERGRTRIALITVTPDG